MGYLLSLFVLFSISSLSDQCLHKARGNSEFHGYLKTSQNTDNMHGMSSKRLQKLQQTMLSLQLLTTEKT